MGEHQDQKALIKFFKKDNSLCTFGSILSMERADIGNNWMRISIKLGNLEQKQKLFDL